MESGLLVRVGARLSERTMVGIELALLRNQSRGDLATVQLKDLIHGEDVGAESCHGN